jgi:hypothetical protein
MSMPSDDAFVQDRHIKMPSIAANLVEQILSDGFFAFNMLYVAPIEQAQRSRDVQGEL